MTHVGSSPRSPGARNENSFLWSEKRVADILMGKGRAIFSDVFRTDKSGWTGLHRVCFNGNLDLVISILSNCEPSYVDIKAKNLKTPLHCACRNGKLDIVVELLRRQADVNSHDSKMETPVYAACEGGHADVLQELINRGADYNTPEIKFGRYPIHVAALKMTSRHLDVVKVLLHHKADKEVINRNGETPIFGILYGENYSLTMKELLSSGSNIEAKDKSGCTIFHRACLGNKLDLINELLMYNVNVNSKDNSSNTPLHAACSIGSFELTLKLIERGANLEDGNISSKTPLYEACVKGRINIILELLNRRAKVYDYAVNGVPIITFLLNYKDEDGNTVLHLGLFRRYLNLVNLIMNLDEGIKGSQLYHCKNNQGCLPLDIALKWPDYDVSTLAVRTIPGLPIDVISRLCSVVDNDECCQLNPSDVQTISNVCSRDSQVIAHFHVLGDSYSGKSTFMKALDGPFESDDSLSMLASWFETPPRFIDYDDRTKGIVTKKYDSGNTRRIFYEYGVS